jgi:hypothetical protein
MDPGRWFLAATGAATAAIGAVFVFLLAAAWHRAKDMRSWPELPCTILSSRIEERRHDPFAQPEYRHAVVFAYEWQGAMRTGSLLSRRGNPWYANGSKAEKSVARFPQGMQTTCRVNPRDPDAAVLKPDPLAPGYTIWFPTLFVVGGLGITLRALRGGRQRPATAGG